MKTSSEAVLEMETPHVSREATHSHPRRENPSVKLPLPQASPLAFAPAVILGTLVGFNQSRAPLVDFSGNESRVALSARSMVVLNESDAGSEIALVFENGNPTKPVILGRLQSHAAETPANPVNVSLDGEQVTLSAKNEIVLRCGKASITLTRAGKIIIRGAYLLSRSSGVNRIKGGSVQIN